jgi:hypothetical protein
MDKSIDPDFMIQMKNVKKQLNDLSLGLLKQEDFDSQFQALVEEL